MIRIEHVTKTFGEFKALNDLNMTVPKGSIYGLMGLNGSGKTTIIRHLAGFLVQDSGHMSIDGEDVFDNEELKKKVCFIPDELYFFKGYTLKDMEKYFSAIYPNWNTVRFREMIEDFGLDYNSNIGKFSKGMKKQASFALSMAAMPEYLILDEPVDGLDPIVRHKLWGYIMSDCADRELTVLVSSHNAKEMEDACNYIGIIADGHMVYEGDLLDCDETLEQLFIEKLGSREKGAGIVTEYSIDAEAVLQAESERELSIHEAGAGADGNADSNIVAGLFGSKDKFTVIQGKDGKYYRVQSEGFDTYEEAEGGAQK